MSVFTDVQDNPVIPSVADGTSSSNVNSLEIGKGSKVFRSDQSGIWLGAEVFADAPFSVDMEGNVTATTGNFLTKTGTTQAFSGSINVGAGNVLIDGANKRILINDGTDDRILLGFQSGGF